MLGNVEPEIGQRLRDGGRMDHVGLAAGALLAVVGFVGELVGLLHEIELGFGIVASDRVADRLKGGFFVA